MNVGSQGLFVGHRGRPQHFTTTGVIDDDVFQSTTSTDADKPDLRWTEAFEHHRSKDFLAVTTRATAIWSPLNVNAGGMTNASCHHHQHLLTSAEVQTASAAPTPFRGATTPPATAAASTCESMSSLRQRRSAMTSLPYNRSFDSAVIELNKTSSWRPSLSPPLSLQQQSSLLERHSVAAVNGNRRCVVWCTRSDESLR